MTDNTPEAQQLLSIYWGIAWAAKLHCKLPTASASASIWYSWKPGSLVKCFILRTWADVLWNTVMEALTSSDMCHQLIHHAQRMSQLKTELLDDSLCSQWWYSNNNNTAFTKNLDIQRRNEILANTGIWNWTNIGLKVEDDERAEEAHSCLFTSN